MKIESLTLDQLYRKGTILLCVVILSGARYARVLGYKGAFKMRGIYIVVMPLIHFVFPEPPNALPIHHFPAF